MSSSLAIRLLRIIDNDKAARLNKIERYLHGNHDDPYMPRNADAEYRLIAQRCISNWIPLVIDTPAQALYVDGFRRGKGDEVGALDSEMEHWQRSRLDARQGPLYRGALAYGHSFTLTLRNAKGEAVTTCHSALKSAGLFADPANDIVPEVFLTVTREPTLDSPGRARLFDGPVEYEVRFRDYQDQKGVSTSKVKKHPGDECPATRFAPFIDLEGRTFGVVEPMIPLQDRINQTVFDLLIAQTYGSFKVRTVTGMAPPIKLKAEVDPLTNEATGELIPDLDDQGRPQPQDMRVSASRFMFAESEGARFGTLDETPLGGYIDSIDMSIRHLAAISQTPPHHLLGQIANLSAEALQAAEQALARKVEEFRKAFGESWERVFRLASMLEGNTVAADDVHSEVLWRDVEARSMAAVSDALLKLKELGIPVRGLMRRVPGVTQTELHSWEEMLDRDPQAQIAQRLTTGSGRPLGTTIQPRLLREEPAA